LPVTAKLSRKFYERLGDDVAGELVDWFNAVDSTYQSQLREINDLNWERFKAELRAVESGLRAEFHAGLDSLRVESAKQDARHHADIAKLQSALIKWMFLFWTGQLVALGGLMLVLQRPH
jgi:hypothetical protein